MVRFKLTFTDESSCERVYDNDHAASWAIFTDGDHVVKVERVPCCEHCGEKDVNHTHDNK